jgi:hypothetical protein
MITYKKFNFIVLLCLFLTLISTRAFANDTYNGRIRNVQLVEGTMQLRVILDNQMPKCNLNFAFVETTSPLFQSYLAIFATARSLDTPVNLQVTVGEDGFCRVYFASY